MRHAAKYVQRRFMLSRSFCKKEGLVIFMMEILKKIFSLFVALFSILMQLGAKNMLNFLLLNFGQTSTTQSVVDAR